MKEYDGKFIVFEGGDGGGKSTQAARLVNYLREQGVEVVLTKEPGGIPETIPIRALILDPRISEDGIAQLLLFAADRRAHLLLEVVPALRDGKLVISDRYYGSTRVYQEERGVNVKTILQLENLAIDIDGWEVEPDVTILLDIAPEIGVGRKENSGVMNYFDSDDLMRHQARRKAYLNLAENLDWKVIDANKTENEVFKDILQVLIEKGIL